MSLGQLLFAYVFKAFVAVGLPDANEKTIEDVCVFIMFIPIIIIFAFLLYISWPITSFSIGGG